METKLAENERQQKIKWSESELSQQTTEAHRVAEMKRIEADVMIECKRQERELITLRANELSKTHLAAEQQTRRAEADVSIH